MKTFYRCLFLLPIFLMNVCGIFAQRTCASHDHYEHLMATDPQFAYNQDQVEKATREFIERGGAKSVIVTQSGTIVFRIPVVFHLLYNNAAQDIPLARIYEQLDVINKDFQRRNPDAVNVPSVYQGRVADVQVEFCLAQRDPQGNPHSGIIRKFTTKTNFAPTSRGRFVTLNEDMKFDERGGSTAWNRDHYLNFWICDLGNSLLGFAQFPGGNAATDGVVCHYNSVGGPNAPGGFVNYGLGRTATHEIGHWLNLRHIWGDANCGNDFVDDTPFHPGSNSGCPSNTLTTSCSQNPGALMMWMNYMDYTFDVCMYMFTNGQKDRMWAVLGPGGVRASLANSMGCIPPGPPPACQVPEGLNSSNVQQTSASVSWSGVTGANSYTVQWRQQGAGTFNTSNTAGTSLGITGLTASTTYEWQVRSNCTDANSAFSSLATFTTQAPSVTCNAPTGLSVATVTTSSANLSWNAVSGATGYRVEYKPSNISTFTSTTLAGTSLTLSGLTASTTYNWRVSTNCDGTLSNATNGPNFTTVANPDACTDDFEPNNTSAEAATITPGQTIQALICDANDRDWYTFSNNNQNRSVRVTLTVPAGVNYNMRLIRPNGQIVGTTSGTSSTKVLTFTGNPTGAYRVEVFSTSGFSTTAFYSLLAEVGSNLRLDAGRMMVLDSDIRLFPNPATNELQLTFGEAWKGVATVNMIDVTGRRVLQHKVNAAGTVSLNVSPISAGFYLLEVTNGELTEIQKVMIRK